MKKTFTKTAMATGLCLSLLAGSMTVSAAFGGSRMGGRQSFGNPMQQQTGFNQQMQQQTGFGQQMQQGGFGQMQQGTLQSAAQASEIAKSSETNTATALEAGDVTATYDVSETSQVKISASGTYVVTGTCADGNITVKKGTTGVVLILRDLDLTSTTGATLSINKTAECKIIVEGSVTLTDAEDPADEDSTDADVADAFDGAAIKVKAGADACITGTGTLTVNGSAKNGIKVGGDYTDDEGPGNLVIDGATVNINAANDGINASYDLSILGGKVTVSAADDGIHADRILTVGGDGSEPTVTISKSNEGIEATVVNLFGGTISVTASDDGVNAANSDALYVNELTYSINIDGAAVSINCRGDGLDSNGNINLVSGSATIQSGTTGGEGGLDYTGSLYVSDDFRLDNAGGVAFDSGMGGGMMGGQPTAPTMGGEQSTAPAMGGEQSTAPAMGGEQSTAPAMGGNQSTAPAMGGNQSTAPAMGGNQSMAPAMGGNQPTVPAMGGNQSTAPAMGGNQSAAPAMGGNRFGGSPMGGSQFGGSPMGGMNNRSPMGGMGRR